MIRGASYKCGLWIKRFDKLTDSIFKFMNSLFYSQLCLTLCIAKAFPLDLILENMAEEKQFLYFEESLNSLICAIQRCP